MSFTRKTVAVLAAGLFAAACGSSGSLSGKVIADGAPLGAQTVVLQGGQKLLTTTTGDDGSYSFGSLDGHTYVLSVDVPSTLERHEQVPVTVNGAIQVPDLVFTSVTTVSGTVTTPDGTPLAGATVLLLGTELSAVTDAAGAFLFTQAPVGARTISVTTADGHAEANLTLVRGEAQTVPLQLAADPPGTVTGSVTFFSTQKADLITVTAAGSGVSTQVQPNGSYSLQLPAGTWTLTASAPYYPTQSIGQVTVTSGGTSTLEPAALSLYTQLPTFGLTAAYWALPSSNQLDFLARKASVLALFRDGGASAPAFYRIDHQTHALRLISVGQPPTLSSDGTWAAIPESSAFLLQNLSTGSSFVVSGAPPVMSLAPPPQEARFSADNSTAVLAFAGSPGAVVWVNLSSKAPTRIDSYETRAFGARQLLVATTPAAPQNWSLVGPAGVSQAFSQVAGIDVEGNGPDSVAVALESCASVPCPVDVLAPDRTTSVRVQGLLASAVPTVGSWVGHWLDLYDGAIHTIVDAEDGSAQALPSGAADVQFSQDGKRLAYTLASGTSLFIAPLPILAPPAPILTSTGPVSGGWLSFTRFVGFDDAPSSGAAYRFTIDSGLLTKDLDYTASSGRVRGNAPATVQWLGSDGVSRVQAGSMDPITAPNGETTAAQWVAPEVQLQIVDGLLAVNAGTHVGVSWEDGATYLYGGATPQVLPGLEPFVNQIVGGMLATTDGSVSSAVDQDSGQQVMITEPDLPIGGLEGSTTVDSTQVLTLAVGPASIDPVTGDPVGGVFAFIPTLFQ